MLINMSDNMSPRGRTESVSPGDVVEAAKKITDPCFGSAEVSAHLSIGPERTREKLNQLSKEEVLETKKVGNANVYWFARC